MSTPESAPMQRRNVSDFYKYWTTEAILADLDEKRHNFSILCANVIGDFNIGSCIRSANAFLAKEIIIYGRKKYDRRSTVGTHLYSHLKHVKELDLDKLKEITSNYYMVGIDNIENSKPIESYIWPRDKHVLMCFGEENAGLPKEILDLCHEVIYISQYGSVRSLNVGVACGISCYDYVVKKSNI